MALSRYALMFNPLDLGFAPCAEGFLHLELVTTPIESSRVSPFSVSGIKRPGTNPCWRPHCGLVRSIVAGKFGSDLLAGLSLYARPGERSPCQDENVPQVAESRARAYGYWSSLAFTSFCRFADRMNHQVVASFEGLQEFEISILSCSSSQSTISTWTL